MCLKEFCANGGCPVVRSPNAALRAPPANRPWGDGPCARAGLQGPCSPEFPHPDVLPVSVNKNYFVRAFPLRSGSGNCSPAADLVFLKLIFPPVFISGGVFFCSQTPVARSVRVADAAPGGSRALICCTCCLFTFLSLIIQTRKQLTFN